ncbi:MAG: DUF4340 domain-containing protein [Granulosicoccus sp.]
MVSHDKLLLRWNILLGAGLLMLLAAIGAVIYSDNKKNTSSQVSPHLIQTLTIQRPDYAEIRLQRLDEQWLVTAPCELPVNQQRLEPLLGALMPTTHSYAANEVDLEAAGLNDPLAVLFLNDSQISVGNTDLNGERRYIKRDDRVEFAPEWILSLINGGLSAIAQLQVFNSPISSIQILDDSKQHFDVPTESITKWQSLSAQQIVSWPLQTSDIPLIEQSVEVTHDGVNRQLELYTYEQFAALRFEDEDCAFILSTDSLPDSSFH